MRKLIVTNIISIDGHYEGPGGNVLALPMDQLFNDYNLERLRAADTLLLGATTFAGFKGYWPGVADDPAAADDQREISRRNNAIDKVVISDSLSPDDGGAWRDTTRIVRRADAHEAVRELKAGDGGDILMFGSRTTWNDLLTAGLIDELHLIVGAVALGAGTPAFTTSARLRLLDARRAEGSENVVLRYAA